MQYISYEAENIELRERIHELEVENKSMFENLTSCQTQCTKQLEEIRQLNRSKRGLEYHMIIMRLQVIYTQLKKENEQLRVELNSLRHPNQE